MSAEVSVDRRDNVGGLTLFDMLQIIRKHIVTALIAFLVVFLAVAAYTFLAPAKYTATAKTYVTYRGQETNSSIGEVNTGGSYISNQIKSFPSLAQSEKVLKPVIDKLGLDMTVADLASEVSVSNPTSTFFVNISDTNRSPQRAAVIANSVADSLSSAIDELYSDSNGSLVKVTVVQSATVPTSKSSPKTKLYLAVGLLLGLIAGIIAALLKDLLSTKIEHQSDVRALVNASSLGSVAKNEELEGKPALIQQPNSATAENFRRICTSLTLMNANVKQKGDGQLIVVTSASAGEGKTTVAVNIAATLAERGKEVLLIDADLRHPSVAKRLGIAGSVGLTHVLSHQSAPLSVIQPYWKENFHVLPAGARPSNAAVLLSSDVMTSLLTQSLGKFDYVVVDTAPMSVASEAVTFGKLAGGVVMVAGKGMCEKRNLTEAAETLESSDVPVLGFVFNYDDAKKNSGNYYYYYYYDDTKEVSAADNKTDADGKTAARRRHAA